jgi:hypothetical protein
MQFFNFWNAQTYHFFVWLTEGGGSDVEALVQDAFAAVEGDPWYELGEAPCQVARDKLAEALVDLLDEKASAWCDRDRDLMGEIGTVDASEDSLFWPMLRDSLDDICFRAVAEAILVRQGKWAPDREPPEIV